MMDERAGITVVVGYDGSDAARRALARLPGLTISCQRVLVVAVAPEMHSAAMGCELAGRDLDPDRLLADAREALDGCEDSTIETRAAVGDPAVVLTDVAREVDAQLLILGRRGGDFVARTLLGSVAERVVKHAPCDVLVVA